MVRRADESDLKQALSPKTLRGSFHGRGPEVLRIRHLAYVDGGGDEALEVIVILADDTRPAQLRWERLDPIRRAIHDAVRSTQDERYPYVHFMTRQEFRETQA